jgi:uncharacterized membrane protein YhhN
MVGLLPPKRRPLLVAYVALAATNVAGQAVSADVLTDLTKPFLIPLLFVWAWQPPWDRPARLLSIGLVFAWLGDVFLMAEGDAAFLAGMGGFLVMQVLYIAAYRAVAGPSLIRARPWILVPFLAFWVGMNLLLDPGALRIPMLVYGLVLVGMGAAAVDLMGRFPQPYAGRVAVGAILFIISDATIALDDFADLAIGNWQAVIVMSTYTAAQFLIVTGFRTGLRARAAA